MSSHMMRSILAQESQEEKDQFKCKICNATKSTFNALNVHYRTYHSFAANPNVSGNEQESNDPNENNQDMSIFHGDGDDDDAIDDINNNGNHEDDDDGDDYGYNNQGYDDNETDDEEIDDKNEDMDESLQKSDQDESMNMNKDSGTVNEYDLNDSDNDDDELQEIEEIEEEEDIALINTPLIMSRGLPGQRFVPQPPLMINFLYTSELVVELLLYNLLRKISAPLGAWSLIMKWAAYAQTVGYDFPKYNSRRKFLEDLRTRFNMTDMKPLTGVAAIDLSPCPGSPKTTKVTYFSIEAAIRSLLTDPMNRNNDNINIDPQNPFGKYIPTDPEWIDEPFSAATYQRKYERFIPQNPNQNYLIFPLIFYLDSTQADRFGNFKVHPVMMASTFHTHKVRRLVAGWRLIGLIPAIYHGYSSADRDRMNDHQNGYAARNLHSILHVIFNELIELQQKGGFIMEKLTINNVTKENVLIITPIHYVMGDMEGNDALAGKTKAKSHISRACHCPYNEADDPWHECRWKTKQEMIELYDNCDTFQEQYVAGHTWSQTPLANVFYKLQFMDDEWSIHGNSPICLMHLMLQGLFQYTGENLMDPLTERNQSRLDRLCRRLIPLLHQSGTKNGYPRCQFKNGITNLSQITADEREGTIFVFTLLFSIPRFNQVTEEFIFPRDKERFPNGSPSSNRRRYCTVCELILIMYAWASDERHNKQFLAQQADKRVGLILNTMKEYAPRLKGDGWNFPKFHECKHCGAYCVYLGSPRQFNCACNEHHHIEIAKRTAARSSFIHSTFDGQVGERYHEDTVVRQVTSLFAACNIFESKHLEIYDIDPGQGVGGMKRFKLYGDDECTSKGGTTLYLMFAPTYHSGSAAPTWTPIIVQKLKKKKQNVSSAFHPDAIEYLVDNFTVPSEDGQSPPTYDYGNYPNMRLRTEYRKGGGNGGRGTIFRCHPNYRGGLIQGDQEVRPWFDWCEILYDTDDSDVDSDSETPGTLYPGRLSFIVEYEDKETHKTDAVVVTEVASDHVQRKTLLTGQFQLCSRPPATKVAGASATSNPRRHKYFTLPVASLSNTCLCIPSFDDVKEKWDRITYVVPVEKWSELFTGNWRTSRKNPSNGTGIRITEDDVLECVF